MSQDHGTFDRRRAGVLLHPTSLPGAESAGAFGDAGRHFVDWLAVGGFTVWQLLPLGPVGADRSPYYARSNHAGNARLVDLDGLAQLGLLPAARVREADGARGAAGVAAHTQALDAATRALFEQRGPVREQYEHWLATAAGWLDDYALFTAIQQREQGRPWWEWPDSLRTRDPHVLAAARRELAGDVQAVCALQWFFHAQWAELRRYANLRGVQLFGDLPIYVAPDSVEVWAHPGLFQLAASGRPAVVAGVPPDYFSADGQLWGNPLYRWDEHQRSGFAWWMDRLRAQLALYDIVRVDHFRGLEAFWSVPADAPTARTGRWVPAPGDALLARARSAFGGLPLVAEDLGVITPEVETLRDDYRLPGMRVLQFGFDSSTGNQHALHEWVPHSIGYTGTHDNDTTDGWFASLDPSLQRKVQEYLDVPRERVVQAMVRSVMRSVAKLAIVPLQDLLGLGTEARMNTPGTSVGNWTWSFEWHEVPPDLGDRCRRMNELYGRT